MKLEIFFPQIFEKHSNIKLHENPSNGNRVVPCRQTDRRSLMTKVIVALHNFENALKNHPTDAVAYGKHSLRAFLEMSQTCQHGVGHDKYWNFLVWQ
jgi:hypothetical protein